MTVMSTINSAIRTYGVALRAPGVSSLLAVTGVVRLVVAMNSIAVALLVTETRGGDYTTVGGVLACFSAGALIGLPWRGHILDRVGLRRGIVLPVFVSAFAWGGMLFVPLPALFLLAAVAGLYSVPVNSIVRQSLAALLDDRTRRTGFAVDGIAVEVSFILGPIGAAALALAFSPGAALAAYSLALLVAGVALLLVNPALKRNGGGGQEGGFTNRGFLVIAAVSGMLSFAMTAVELGVIATLTDASRFALIGVAVATISVAALVGNVVAGALPKLPSLPVMVLLLGVALALQSLGDDSVVLLFAGAAAVGFIFALLYVQVGEVLAAAVPENRRGEAFGWQGGVLQLFAMVSWLASGVVLDRTGIGGYVILAVPVLVVALVAWTMRRESVRYIDLTAINAAEEGASSASSPAAKTAGLIASDDARRG